MPFQVRKTGLFVVAASALPVAVFSFRWEELVNRELDALEGVAGIIRVAGALFFRNAVIVRGDEHLHIALHLDDREQSEGNQYRPVAGVRGKVAAANSIRNRSWHRAAAGVTAALAGVAHAGGEDDGVYALHLCDWVAVLGRRLVLKIFLSISRGENFDVAVTAVKDALLGEDRKSNNRVGNGCGGGVHIEGKYKEEGNIHGIEAVIKGYLIHIDGTSRYFAFSAFDGNRGIDYCLIRLSKGNAEILQAILVNTRVVNTLRVNADSLVECSSVVQRGCAITLSHK